MRREVRAEKQALGRDWRDPGREIARSDEHQQEQNVAHVHISQAAKHGTGDGCEPEDRCAGSDQHAEALVRHTIEGWLHHGGENPRIQAHHGQQQQAEEADSQAVVRTRSCKKSASRVQGGHLA